MNSKDGHLSQLYIHEGRGQWELKLANPIGYKIVDTNEWKFIWWLILEEHNMQCKKETR